MLIHKKTMGILEYVWTGHYRRGVHGEKVPVLHRARLADYPELNPEEWWELPDDHPLITTIHRGYPWLTPVIGPNGELLGVRNEQAEERARQKQEEQQQRREQAQKRGYRRNTRLRPLGLFSFLNVNEEDNTYGSSSKN